MNKFIISQLEQIDGLTYYVDDGNIYVTKGVAESYPCQVAHTDTVHHIINNFVVFQHDDKLFSIDGDSMDRVGIGGDDKVGIFVVLQMLREVNVMKAAFFRDEEIGCVGSRAADMKFFNDVEFVLQCDRKGYKDFVSEIWGTQMYSSDFSWAINGILTKFGRKETDGGMTDVYQLAENGLGVCVANMSCGYYQPHTDNEYIVISEVNETLNLCIEIFAGLSGHIWEIKRVKKTYRDYFGLRGGWNRQPHQPVADYRNFSTSDDDYWFGDDDDSSEYISYPESCYNCGTTQLNYDEVDDEMFCFDCNDYVYADREKAVQHVCRLMGIDVDAKSIAEDVNVEDIPKMYTIEDFDKLSDEDEDIGGKTQIHLRHIK
jgi:hypothetical protein